MLSLPLALLFSLVPLVFTSHNEDLRRSPHHHGQSPQSSVTYHLKDHYTGKAFMNESIWKYRVGNDPTNGLVNYVSHATAAKEGLAYVQNGVAVLKFENRGDLPLNKPRNSTRISSVKTYSSGLFIADFARMPFGCAVWPAYWSVGPNWPNHGEIDVIEGVDTQSTNLISFHTGGSTACSIDTTKNFTGQVSQPPSGCKTTSSNQGCGFWDSQTSSYGSGFNAAGGGVFVHLWDNSKGISVWHFPRSSIPQDILSGKPNPALWPAPVAFLSSSKCNIPTHFSSHQLVIDTTLCGGFATAEYSHYGCPGTCPGFVAKGSNFNNVMWMINYISVYQPV
ncbi:glycoside hydrolase family 16 protein [Russula earlei]|uniref:Glycoside hydrolase family 16 protein n=1 Tax=Russula earlei TaxID=71964 RepID=A0ACC0TZ32_9AGAM|nr:glycoside hydrolase family 16 protein [Russula earlei]